jgi:hypothetical protein
MAFALSVVMLEEALKKPGCPVCRMSHDAAIHSVDSFLWENTNDPGARKPINDAYGFCPEHTRLLVASELSTSGIALGVNMIYELLAKIVSQDLKKQERKQRVTNSVLGKLGLKSGNHQTASYLEPKGRYPVCVLAEEAAKNTLSNLFEELSSLPSEFHEIYQKSSGICLGHLRVGLNYFADEFPKAAHFLAQDAVQRLEIQRAEMLEYIRKQNWAYRDEKLTPEESTAWLRTLAFFTGYPQDRFNHLIDKF